MHIFFQYHPTGFIFSVFLFLNPLHFELVDEILPRRKHKPFYIHDNNATCDKNALEEVRTCQNFTNRQAFFIDLKIERFCKARCIYV